MQPELPVIRRCYDALLWFIPFLSRLPRGHRHVLGERMQQQLYELLELLIRARYAPGAEPLEQANARLEVLRYQVRLLVAFDLMDLRRYEHAAGLLTDLGRELGGWLKYRRSRGPALKRSGNLWGRLTAWENLHAAACQARRGKRYRPATLEFDDCVEETLIALQAELRAGVYRPGEYRSFVIYEPKRRLISAAPYRDRVVHHALCRIIEPIFERTFLGCSFANRVGYGTHRALRRFTHLLRSHRWVLRGDIRQFFPSIDHETLLSLVARKIKCPPTLELIRLIVANSNEQEAVESVWRPGDDLVSVAARRRGLPIGNLTSQFFANVLLDPLDHFMVETLRRSAYVRYVDDFAVFAHDPAELRDLLAAIEAHLAALRLRLHPTKTQIREARVGSSFVGFQVLPDRIRVRAANLRRGRRRLRALAADVQRGDRPAGELTQRVQAWAAHLAHGDTWRLREQLFGSLQPEGPKKGQAYA